MFRRTKIVATVGPASEDEQQLNLLMQAGVNVFRLNFSHGELEKKAHIITRIREISRQHKRAVAILGDLQGPKIRVGLLKGGEIELSAGEQVTLTTRDLLGEKDIIPTTYEDLPQDVQPGNRILLDDGLMELNVLQVSGDDVRCQVISGGLLKDRKGINLPGVKVSAPALTAKDLDDLDFCIKQELDYVALSFVRQPADVSALQTILRSKKARVRVIAKIEKPGAVESFQEILAVSDGIMVARGDLGVEISPEKVPLIQKQIIRDCNQAGKPVITATQMLESMVINPRPTRAETSDIANAILDGTDAIMLSAETATGNYAIEAVAVMDRVAQDIERDQQVKTQVFEPISNNQGTPWLTEAIGQAACRVAVGIGAQAILAFTQTGGTAALVAKFRPQLPIIAVTPSPQVRRRMALYSGVHALRVDIEGDTEAQIETVNDAVLSSGWFKEGDNVVLTMGSPLSDPGTTNLLKVHCLKPSKA